MPTSTEQHMITWISSSLEESLAHGEQVAKLAENIFTGTEALHNLNKYWKNILIEAAQLHDIGWIYGKRGHHKASASMIRAGEIRPVDKKIRHLVALVARYHRRAAPDIQQWRFAALDKKEQQAIRILSGIIRLADALDFSHKAAINKVKVTINKHSVHLLVHCQDDCQAEILRIDQKKELFCQVFGKDVSCSSKSSGNL